MKKEDVAGYRLADQFARLEAARAYVKAANEILNSGLRYESRNPELSYLKQEISGVAMSLTSLEAMIDQTMSSMETDLAIEGGGKETIRPTPAAAKIIRDEMDRPLRRRTLSRVDEPFSQE